MNNTNITFTVLFAAVGAGIGYMVTGKRGVLIGGVLGATVLPIVAAKLLWGGSLGAFDAFRRRSVLNPPYSYSTSPAHNPMNVNRSNSAFYGVDAFDAFRRASNVSPRVSTLRF